MAETHPKPEYVLPDLHPLCVPLDSVELDPRNANVHPPSHIAELQQTLRVYRQHKPLVVQPRKNGKLVCKIGNGTLRAARKEGWDYIAVVRADTDNDMMAMARAIRDNTAAWGSAFDEVELQTQLQALDAWDGQIAAGLGWEPDDLEAILAASADEPVEPEKFHGPSPTELAGELSQAFEDEEIGGPEPGKTREAKTKFNLLSESNEWYTPQAVVEAAREVMGGIDVDPASCAEANEVVQATMFYDAEADGLSKEWDGNVWLNPPYGRDEKSVSNAAKWTHLLIEQYEDGIVEQGCLLVNGSFGYKWFRPLWSFPICFFYERIAFRPPASVEDKGHPTHSNVAVYMGDNIDKFIEVFSRFGRVVVPHGDHAAGHGE